MILEILIGFTVVLFILYSCLEGRRDGYFYHYRNTTTELKNENIHWIYFVERALILSFISVIHVIVYESYVSAFMFVSGLALIFSFFHNGMYYETRKKLSDGKVYPMGWVSNSTSSQATLELKWKARVWLAVIGIASIITSFNINILNKII